MTPQRRLKRLSPKTQRQQDDRVVRQIEDHYKRRGYTPESIENEAEMDFQIIQRLNKRKRGLRNIKLTGMEN